MLMTASTLFCMLLVRVVASESVPVSFPSSLMSASISENFVGLRITVVLPCSANLAASACWYDPEAIMRSGCNPVTSSVFTLLKVPTVVMFWLLIVSCIV